jgi:hypothetical protein
MRASVGQRPFLGLAVAKVEPAAGEAFGELAVRLLIGRR